jgi:hypothetical protein
MLTLVDATGPYTLPTHWGEVSTGQYCELDKLQLKTVEARASYFAARPIQVNGLVADALAWMLHPVPTDADTLRYPSDLGLETFLQVASIQELLAKQPLHQCLVRVYGLFVARARDFRGRAEYVPAYAARLQSLASELPITETYPAVLHCLSELKRLAEEFSELGEPDRTDAGQRAREAGSDRLQPFGHLNIARHYAERFGTSLEAVYQWPYRTVALYLWQDRINAEIQDILSRPKP